MTAAMHIAKTDTNIGSVNTLGGMVEAVLAVVIPGTDGGAEAVLAVVIPGTDGGAEAVLAVVIPGTDGGADAILYLGLSVHYPHRIMYARRLVESMSNMRPFSCRTDSMP
jgi:hypothetical protein